MSRTLIYFILTYVVQSCTITAESMRTLAAKYGEAAKEINDFEKHAEVAQRTATIVKLLNDFTAEISKCSAEDLEHANIHKDSFTGPLVNEKKHLQKFRSDLGARHS